MEKVLIFIIMGINMSGSGKMVKSMALEYFIIMIKADMKENM